MCPRHAFGAMAPGDPLLSQSAPCSYNTFWGGCGSVTSTKGLLPVVSGEDSRGILGYSLCLTSRWYRGMDLGTGVCRAGVLLGPHLTPARGWGGPRPCVCVVWLYSSLSAIGATWRGPGTATVSAQISLRRLGPALLCVHLS